MADLEYRVNNLEKEVEELRRMIKSLSCKNKELDSRTSGLIVIGGATID
jgi:hypothetical protein